MTIIKPIRDATLVAIVQFVCTLNIVCALYIFCFCSIPDVGLGPSLFAKCGEEYIPACWLVV